MDCLSSVPCCASCDDAQPNYRCGGCEAAETSALLCPQRSSCALSYFVGDEPARCCSRCDSTEIRERDNKRCEQKESYVHECRVESACVQAHLALARDAVYVPWQAAALNTAAALFSVAVSGDEVWAVGSSGFAARLSSSGRWQLETTPTTENLLGVWVSPAGTVWVVGIDGSILRRDQAGWQKVESPTNVALQAIWGRDETHIWAVGQSATVLEYDGINWRQLSSATDVDLTAIGGNADQLWIVGDKGVILRRDGPNENGFSAVESGTDLPLTGVYVSSSDNRSPSDNKVWIVGVGGTVSAWRSYRFCHRPDARTLRSARRRSGRGVGMDGWAIWRDLARCRRPIGARVVFSSPARRSVCRRRGRKTSHCGWRSGLIPFLRECAALTR
jgi:hypothetical protein